MTRLNRTFTDIKFPKSKVKKSTPQKIKEISYIDTSQTIPEYKTIYIDDEAQKLIPFNYQRCGDTETITNQKERKRLLNKYGCIWEKI